MPSSYTPSLRLTLPVTGELAGTWGSTVNTGVTTLAEAAIAGTAAVAMTDADYTLTVSNGATDQARNMFITLTGTLSVSRNVICPAVSKLYVVTNSTTGSQNIVFKTSAGAGITVANGQRKILYCNGTNVLDATTSFTSIIFDAGTVSAPSIAFAGNTSTGFWLPTTSTVALSTAGVERLRVDSSGNLGVGTSSPTSKLHIVGGTLSVQNTLGFGATFANTGGVGNYITISDSGWSSAIGTSNGNLILYTAGNTTERARIDTSGNFGVGTTVVTAKLDVVGGDADGIQYRTGTRTVGIGQVANEASLYWGSATALTFFSGSERMRLDTSGNLGIGTATPAARLHATVSGAGQATPAALFFSNNDGFAPQSLIGLAIYNNRSSGFLDTNLVYGNSANSYLAIGHHNGTTYAERMRLDASGNLGVGTASPYWKLSVSDGTVNGGMTPNGGNLYFGTKSNHPVLFRTNDTDRMTLDSSGNLGIGTNAPSQKVHVYGTDAIVYNQSTGSGATTVAGFSLSRAGASAGLASQSLQFDVGGGGGGADIYTLREAGAGGNLVVRTDNTSGTKVERLRIDSSGNFLVNETSAKYAAANRGLIEVNGTTSALLGLSVNNTAAGYLYSTSTNLYVGAPTGYNILFDINGEKMRLDPSGNLGIGIASPAARLDVGGNTASAVQAIFARGVSDPNFQLTAYVGNVGSAAGTVMTRFGQSYSSAAMNAGFEFLRGNAASDGAISFVSGSAATMRLDSSGNLGLGVTPSAWSNYKAVQVGYTGALSNHVNLNYLRLESNSFNGGSGETYIQNGPATKYAQNNGAGVHAWSTAPSGTAGAAITFTQAMTLDASGSLGIGTSSPGNKLHVVGSGTISQFSNGVDANFNIKAATSLMTVGTGVAGSSLALMTGDVERMRLDSSGNLLVGKAANDTTTSGTTVAKFSANVGCVRNVKTATGTFESLQNYHSGSYVGGITYSDTATALVTSSDYRLKDITGPITTSGAYIDSLNPVEGTWKADGSTFVGLIAHEVQEVSRTAVATGEKDGEQMQAMDYSNAELVANLIAEIQSLRARVAALEAV